MYFFFSFFPVAFLGFFFLLAISSSSSPKHTGSPQRGHDNLSNPVSPRRQREEHYSSSSSPSSAARAT